MALRSPEAIARKLTYLVWREMRKRCEDQTNEAYAAYGGRGIKVCQRWGTFTNFLTDMGLKPTGYSIDREDVNGDYEPDNCRWIPRIKQTATSRKSKHKQQVVPTVLKLRAEGMTQKQIAEVVELNPATVSRVLAEHGMQSRVTNGRKWVRVGECCASEAKVIDARDRWIDSVMWEVFEYARLMDGFDALDGEEREAQRGRSLAQVGKIRALLRREGAA